MATLVSPSLTTVHQPCRELGRLAAEHVLQSIRNPGMQQHIHVPYQLQLRASTVSPGRR
jgi:LacI family transcriptional regulator